MKRFFVRIKWYDFMKDVIEKDKTLSELWIHWILEMLVYEYLKIASRFGQCDAILTHWSENNAMHEFNWHSIRTSCNPQIADHEIRIQDFAVFENSDISTYWFLNSFLNTSVAFRGKCQSPI